MTIQIVNKLKLKPDEPPIYLKVKTKVTASEMSVISPNCTEEFCVKVEISSLLRTNICTEFGFK